MRAEGAAYLFPVRKTSALEPRNGEQLPPAVILAGGLGTRLRDVYSSGPKCLAPVAGHPFLEYVLTWLRLQGVTEVVLCVGYKRSSVKRYVGSGRKWGLSVKYSIERRLLGTGGALKKAERLISGGRMLVINGDTLVKADLRELIRFHERRRAPVTMLLIRVRDSGRYGAVRLDRRQRVTAFLEKERQEQRARAPRRLINAGVYILEKKVLGRIRTLQPASLERDVFPGLAESRRIGGFVSNGRFIDIGVPEDFWRAQRELREW